MNIKYTYYNEDEKSLLIEINNQTIDIDELAKLLNQYNIKAIQFSNTTIDDEHWIQLPDLLKNSQVEELVFLNNKISKVGAESLAQIVASSFFLTTLKVSMCDFSADKIKPLSRILTYYKTTLEHLDLSLNKIGNDGAIHLAKSLPYTSLKHLNLSHCHINDIGASYIAKRLKCVHGKTSSLQSLCLFGNLEMTSTSLEAFEEVLQENPNFMHLSPGGTDVLKQQECFKKIDDILTKRKNQDMPTKNPCQNKMQHEINKKEDAKHKKVQNYENGFFPQIGANFQLNPKANSDDKSDIEPANEKPNKTHVCCATF